MNRKKPEANILKPENLHGVARHVREGDKWKKHNIHLQFKYQSINAVYPKVLTFSWQFGACRKKATMKN